MSERIFNVSRSTKTGKTVNVGDFPTVEHLSWPNRFRRFYGGLFILEVSKTRPGSVIIVKQF